LPELSITAANQGRLPLFKIYGPHGAEALKAALYFAKAQLEAPSVIQQIAEEAAHRALPHLYSGLDEALRQYRRLSSLTLAILACSLVLLIVGAIGALVGTVQVGTLTSIGSLLTGAVSGLLYRRLGEIRKDLTAGMERARQDLARAMEQLGGAAATPHLK
jgi:hypothetical protein